MVLNGISFISTSIRFLLSKRELLVPPSLMLMSPLDDLRHCTLKGVWQLTDGCPGGMPGLRGCWYVPTLGYDWLKGGWYACSDAGQDYCLSAAGLNNCRFSRYVTLIIQLNDEADKEHGHSLRRSFPIVMENGLASVKQDIVIQCTIVLFYLPLGRLFK